MSEELEKAQADKREHPVAKLMGWLATAVCLVWLGWLGRGLAPQTGAGGAPAMLGPPPGGATPVQVQSVEMIALNPPYEYIGRVEPIQDVELRAQIEGAVQAVHFKEGAIVKEGDLLFTIDPEQYEARVAVRKAEIGQAEAALDRGERYLKRLEVSDVRAITQTDLDTARSDVAQGRASIQQAKANLAVAEIDLKHTRIIAPIGGRIGRTVANVGDYVSPALGTLVRIVQTDPIRVAFSVTDKDYLKMKENIADAAIQEALRIRLRLPTGTVPEMTGTRDFEDNAMSSETATLSVRARFCNAQGLLVPNGYVTVLVDLADAPKHPVVPQEALLKDRDGAFAYVVDQEGKAQIRRVETGLIENGRVAILSGVQAGEKMVVQGVQKVVPGQPVHVTPANQEVLKK